MALPRRGLHRLRALQTLCVDHELDALLLIGGVDARYHPGSKRALGWLLNGQSGRDLFSSSGRVELDDVVLIVTPHGARVYAPPPVHDALAARLSRWGRLQTWSPPPPLLDDSEAVEQHKILSFIEMLDGLSRVGVPVATRGAADGARGGAAATVEAWPLVQAFALQEFEGITGGGFFTQRHVVKNVGEAVDELLLRVDEESLQWLVDSEGPRLRGCWAECEGAFDVVANSGNSLRRAETDLFEPALTYFAFGRLRGGGGGEDAPPPPLARTRLLLGGRSALCAGACESSAARPAEAGGCEPQPRHATLELCEPQGALYVGRAYFLGGGIRPPPTTAPPPPLPLVEEEEAAAPFHRRSHARAALAAAAAAAAEAASEDARVAHVDALQGVYGALWSCAHEAAVRKAGALRGDGEAVAAEVAAEVARCVAEGRVPVGAGWRPVVGASVAFVDLLGNPREGSEAEALARNGKLLVQLRLVLRKVVAGGEAAATAEAAAAAAAAAAAGGDPDGGLGGLLVAETCVADGRGGLCSLTDAVPPYGCWRAAGAEARPSPPTLRLPFASRPLPPRCSPSRLALAQPVLSPLISPPFFAAQFVFSRDLLAACQEASKALAAPDAAAGGGTVPLPRAPHPIIGGLLGALLVPQLTSCWLLSGVAAYPPSPCTLYACARGLVLEDRRAGCRVLFFDGAAAPRSLWVSEATAAADGADGLFLTFRLPAAALLALLGSQAFGVAAARAACAADAADAEVTLALLSAAEKRAFRREVAAVWRGSLAPREYALVDAPPAAAAALRRGGGAIGEALRVRAEVEMQAAVGRPIAPLDEVEPVQPAPAEGAREVRRVLPLGGARAAAARLTLRQHDLARARCTFASSHFVSHLTLVLADAADALVAYTSSSARWLPAPPGAAWCRDSGECDAAALAAALRHALASTSPGALPERIVLQTAGFVEAEPAVRAVLAACAAVPSASLRLAAAAACVDAPRAAASPPGLIEQLPAGLVQTVVVCHADEPPAEAYAALARRLAAVNPSASLARAPRRPRGAAAALADLLRLAPSAAPLPFDAEEQRAARAATSPGWRAPPAAPRGANAALGGAAALTLPPPPPLRLAEALAALRRVALHASGVLATPDGAVSLDWSAAAPRPPRPAAAAAPSALLVVARGVSARQLGEALLACRPQPQRAALLSRASLPAEELAALRARVLRERPLPEGVFYDGASFIDMDGERTNDHPELASAIEELLEERNASAAKHNQEIEHIFAAMQVEAEQYLALIDAGGKEGIQLD
ncbi:hypothetical protein AB1Y20_012631 [Prymnesium parvum]|uniref:DAAF9 N-terminal domain-containing protein n=1 Tax=Prymnesium parvum TaxID=97485 RepID=A0AB34IJ00_PRYPA